MQILLARDLEIRVLSVERPPDVMALEGTFGRRVLVGPTSIFTDPPRLQHGWRPNAAAVVWPVEDAWFIGDGIRLHPGDDLGIEGLDVRAESEAVDATVATIQSVDFAQPLTITVRFDSVHIRRDQRPALVIAGIPARILTELALIGAPIGWEVIAESIWSGLDRSALRQRWDMHLVRLRWKLREAGVRTDLVRPDARVWTATGAAVLAATGVTGAFWVQASERAQTELALAHGLAARAATASQNGARAEAELLAISALELAESPIARGVLARWAAHPRPQRLAEGLSQCSRGWRSDGTQLCRDGDDLVLHSDAGVVSTHRVPQDPAVPFSEAQLYDNALLTRDVVRAWNDGQSNFLAGHPGANYLATGHRAAYIHQNSVYTVDGGTEPRLVSEAVCDRAEGLHTVGEHILVVCHESIVHIDPTEHHTYGVPGQPVLARWAGRVVAVTYQGDVLIRRADAWQVVETNAGPVAEAVVVGEDHLIVTTESGVTRVLNTNTGRWLTDLPQGVHAAVPKSGVVRLFGPDGWTDYAGVIQPPMSLDLSVNGGVGDMAWQGEGGLLLIGSADGSSTLWNPATGTTERLGQGSDNVAKAMGWFQGDWMYPADVVRHKDWSAPEGSWFSQVAATDDVAILRGYGGQLYAFDGTALTPISYPEHIRALTATNDQWWVALVSGTVEAFDGSTRTHSLHLTPAPSILAATPEHLAVGVDDHLSLMTLDGQTAWTAQLPDIITSLAVNDAFAVAGLQNGALHILDGQTGEQHAVVTTHKRRVASLLLQNNTLVSGSWDGWVHHFDLSVLDADAAALKTTIEGAWGMTAADIAL